MFASLTGLSVGDAFGQRFFSPAVAAEHLGDRSLPPAPWRWTDDTNMALSIVDVLVDHGTVDQDALAASFGEHFEATRGYGAGMHRLLPGYAVGADWRREANRLFGGMGSYGNGAAMRVAPLGADFCSDLERVVVEAGKSATVTHAHPEAIAGAIAVAIAAAIAADAPKTRLPGPSAFTESVIAFTPASEVRQRLIRIGDLTPSSSLADAVTLLGNGSRITAQDTVAFCVWVASHHLDDYPAALWLTVRARGDIDTTCVIVGGIIAARTRDVIPSEWLTRREPLPGWAPVTRR
jgi:ADP-ribosylglycohydrolase